MNGKKTISKLVCKKKSPLLIHGFAFCIRNKIDPLVAHDPNPLPPGMARRQGTGEGRTRGLLGRELNEPRAAEGAGVLVRQPRAGPTSRGVPSILTVCQSNRRLPRQQIPHPGALCVTKPSVELSEFFPFEHQRNHLFEQMVTKTQG